MEGSLFIQKVCKQMQDMGDLNVDFVTMMTDINRNITSTYEETKMHVQLSSSLTRLVKFTTKK